MSDDKEIRGPNVGVPRPPSCNTHPALCYPIPVDDHVFLDTVSAPDRGVLAKDQPIAAIGDKQSCAHAGGGMIMTGATEYLVDGQPAARLFDTTDHNTLPPSMAVKYLLSLSPLLALDTGVLIGGGTTVGNVKAATAACMALNGGRAKPGNHGPGNQSYENCGDECVRMIVNARNKKQPGDKGYLTEDDVFYRGLAVGGAGDSDYQREDGTSVEFTDNDKCDKLKEEYHAARDAEGSEAKTKLLEAQRKESEAKKAYEAAKRNEQNMKDTPVSDYGGFPNQAAKAKAEQTASDARSKAYVDYIAAREQQAAAEQEYLNSAHYGDTVKPKYDAWLKCREKVQRGHYESGPAKPYKRHQGGTSDSDRHRMLQSYGVGSTFPPATVEDTETSVQQGKGVIMPMDNMPDGKGGNIDHHIVVVTGYEYDENGNMKQVIYNDTVRGCGSKMEADEFKSKCQKGARANVTSEKVW